MRSWRTRLGTGRGLSIDHFVFTMNLWLLLYPLLVERALRPSLNAPEHPLLPGVAVGSRNVRASMPTIQVRL
jgi:hypothetical protein